MERILTRKFISILVFLLSVAVLSLAVWWVALMSGFDNLSRRGEADMSLAADRLSGQLQRFRELAVLLADHPVLTALVGTQGSDGRAAQELLRRTADKTGSKEIFLLDRGGQVVSASGSADVSDLSATPYVRRALQGALGAHHEANQGDQDRVFTFAAPIFGEDGPVTGVVVVRLSVETIETDWRADPQAIFFTDAKGVVFTANRSELLFQQRLDRDDGGEPSEQYAGVTLVPFIPFQTRQIGEYEVWQLDGGRYLPRRALHVERPLPVIGMTAEILVDAAPAYRLAGLQAAATGALCLVFGAALLLLGNHRRALSERLRLEASANAVLESRVATRTRALSDANAALRREVAERMEAEAALTRAQADLVQVGKLSALGQMSAGISHELNQPLMAIRSFAENAEAFLERGKPDIAAQNLGRISELARRMGRIIKNLRAFARQESEPMGRVDLCAILTHALELTETRMRRDAITVATQMPTGPVWVRGGEVRLGQVFVNLLTNAADAVAGEQDRRITVTLGPDAVVHVRDSGPGLSDPDKIFDPFYTTKEVGASEGMGLGLSISYGIVQSCGGVIRGSNPEDGGAMFEVALRPWQKEQAA